jgi:hypothetical protein
VTCVAIIRSNSPFGMGQFGVIQALAPSLGVEITSISVLDAEELTVSAASPRSSGV